MGSDLSSLVADGYDSPIDRALDLASDFTVRNSAIILSFTMRKVRLSFSAMSLLSYTELAFS
jgi:hypothetical protein